jgi:hypothetical protein
MAGFLVGTNELGKLYWVEQFLLSCSNVVSHKHGLSGWIPPEKGEARMPATAGRKMTAVEICDLSVHKFLQFSKAALHFFPRALGIVVLL